MTATIYNATTGEPVECRTEEHAEAALQRTVRIGGVARPIFTREDPRPRLEDQRATERARIIRQRARDRAFELIERGELPVPNMPEKPEPLEDAETASAEERVLYSRELATYERLAAEARRPVVEAFVPGEVERWRAELAASGDPRKLAIAAKLGTPAEQPDGPTFAPPTPTEAALAYGEDQED